MQSFIRPQTMRYAQLDPSRSNLPKDPVRDGVAGDSHAHAASVLLLGHTPELSVLAALTGQPF